MKRNLIAAALCICGAALHAQSIDNILTEVARNNKSLQAQQETGKAEKIGIEAENSMEDPSVEYSSFYSKGHSGQAGSELVVSQGFDFPTVYGSRKQAGQARKTAIDYRMEASRRNILLEARNLCLDLIRLNKEEDLLEKRRKNADELLALYEERLKAGDATLIEVNKIKMERMSIQTEALQNTTDHRTALQALLALNGNKPLTFEGREYPAAPDTRNFESLYDEVMAADADLKAAEADMQAAEHTLSTNRQKWLPKIEIGYRRNTGEDSKEHGFLVGGSIPLFSNRKQVTLAEAESVGTRLAAEDLRLQTEAALHSGFNELQQLRKALSVYDLQLMLQTLDLLQESVKGGELSVIDYFTEADQIYRNLQAYLQIENRYHKVISTLYKNRL